MEERYLPRSPLVHQHLVWDTAVGSRVEDPTGRQLIDFTSGVLVANIGHSHPRVVEAITRQAGRLLNCYDAPHPLRGEVARRLVEAAGETFEAAALFTTGSEAIDAGTKLAKAFTGRWEVVSFVEGFHGRSVGPASSSGLASVRRGFGPLIPGTIVVPYPASFRCPVRHCRDACDLTCLQVTRTLIRANSTGNVAAVLVEPYLGAGGAHVPPAAFWPALRELCDELGALLIFDEVQASFGRTGAMFAFQSLGVVPDILVVAKGIAGGVPMSAIVTSRAILDALPPGSLGSTYGGNPLACAACLATLDVLESESLAAAALTKGHFLIDVLTDFALRVPQLGEVRGIGLSLGLDFVTDRDTRTPNPRLAEAVVFAADAAGVVVLPPAGEGGNVVRLAPPLSIPEADLHEGAERLMRGISQAVDSFGHGA
jgi:4-aminobutyrate aminotransferase-like enzyme